MTLPTRDELANLLGEFSWDFGQLFFIETERGNFVWSDPDYNGDNTIRPFAGTYQDFTKKANVEFCRSKGHRTIGAYVDADFVYKPEEPWGN